MLLATAMTAGALAGAAPAVAVDPAPSQFRSMDLPDTDRGKAVALWREGGPALRAAAETALVGSDTDVRQFLDAGRTVAEAVDDRQLAMDIATRGGRKLREAAQAALGGTPQQLRDFLASGWRAPLETDQRIEAARAIGAGGRHVQEAGRAALDGSIDDVRTFLTDKYQPLKDLDDRIAAARAIGEGGPATQAAGRAALDGSIDNVRDFVKVGRFVARAQDLEYADVTKLAGQASESAAAATRETDAAKEASDQSVQAAKLAKQAAADAAAETVAAQNDAAKAAAAADRAAAAARRAAEAAQSAISAARAANAAARQAASAAADASQIAASIEQLVSQTREAAALASTDATKADAAKKAAQAAREATKNAPDIIQMAQRAKEAGNAARDAVNAANDALVQVGAAAQSADDAGNAAKAVGASADESQAAAASARRHAQEATRAAAAVAAFAAQAADAATEAMTAVNSAVAHATAAADAADAAAAHAGQAADAAAQATAHADAATQAAAASTTAADSAKRVHELALKTADEDLTARTNESVADAQDQKAAYDADKARAAKSAADRKALADQATALAADATKPGADPQQVATNGRKIAVAVAKTGGPWSVAAAEFALAQSGDAARDYARTGWQKAVNADERQRTLTISWETEQPELSLAALTAMQGGAAAIHTFLTTGQHQVAAIEYRKQVARIMGEGGRKVQEAGRAALDANTTDALLQFLNSAQFVQRETDDRIEIARLIGEGGPEVQAAGRIALEGAPIMQRQFLTLGQFNARHKDQLTAAHNARIQSAISQAYASASTAQQQAFEAREAAARARNAEQEARGYAAQAAQSAKAANDAVEQARASAERASLAAAQAAQEVRAANAASASAQKASEQAQEASARAAGIATAAQEAADVAHNYAAQVRTSAEAAHASAIDAGQASSDAYDKLEFTEMLQRAMFASKMQGIFYFTGNLYHQTSEDDHNNLALLGSIPYAPFEIGANGYNCAWYGIEGQWMDAAGSCLAAIPALGEIASAYNLLKWGKKGQQLADEAAKAQKAAKKLENASCMLDLGDSFPAGTRVLMGDRTARAIEQIRVGDTVLATDPGTGQTIAERVDKTITTPDDEDFTEIDVVGPDSVKATFTVTDRHLIWSVTANNWVYAAGVVPGTLLRTPEGRTAKATGVRYRHALQTAYNLTVHDLHTYYVHAGATPVLVHNANDTGVRPRFVTRGIRAVLSGRPQRRDLNGNLDYFDGRDLSNTSRYRSWITNYTGTENDIPEADRVTTRIYDMDGGGNGYRIIVREQPGRPNQYAWVPPGPNGVHNYGALKEFKPECI
ncbi:polymorphic toxin-type HINT domain-containing protein [Kitasatospora sp. NPDC001664]